MDTVEHLDAAAFPVLTLLGDIELLTDLSDDALSGLDLVIDGIRARSKGASAALLVASDSHPLGSPSTRSAMMLRSTLLNPALDRVGRGVDGVV